MNTDKLKKPDLQRIGKRSGKYYGHLIDQDFLLGRDPREDNWMAPDNKTIRRRFSEEHAYLLEIPLPGWEKDNIHVSLKENVLTIKGKIREDHKSRHPEYIAKEHYLDEFDRSFELTAHTDQTRIKAIFKNGMLRIHLYFAENSEIPWPMKIFVE